MTKKRTTRNAVAGHEPSAADGKPATEPRGRGRIVWRALGVFALLFAAALYFGAVERGAKLPASAPGSVRFDDKATEPEPTPAYLGGAVCASCHAEQHRAWSGSHHDRAMAEASPVTVLGSFSGVKFSHAGVTSTFFSRDGKFFVNTAGPDGKLADYEIKYTFGFSPLQQYLIEFPGGRLQALGIAWDSRTARQGGQRWFHLYPDRKLQPGEPLHWTGIDQVWNYQCADCHSTNLRKNYDETTNSYATSWTDINVTCEACHGPGSNHVTGVRRHGDGRRFEGAGKGLAVVLDERRDVRWAIDAETGSAARSMRRDSSRAIEVCARCHARRGQFTDTWHAGIPLADGYRASRIEPGLYYADGQMRDEVYNYGSLLQSRMHQKGVTCSDCHEPHTLRLRASGNAVCGQCHAAAKYDAGSHHHHTPGSPGAECASCHMPTTAYMGVDRRHDHGFRIPRPDRTVSLGTPNACNQCHADRKAEWAAAAVQAWYPQPRQGFQTFAEAFSLADRGAPGAQRALMAVADDRQQSAIARASAIGRLGRYLSPSVVATLGGALEDTDAMVRAAAVESLSGADGAMRARLLPRVLADPIREVRISAARALAGEPETRLSSQARGLFENALDEYVAAQRFNADRPEARTNLGNLYASRGRPADAIAAYRGALTLDPAFQEAALNLADLYRSRGLEEEAEKTIREALQRDPRSAPAHFALGLSLARQKRAAAALQALAQAAKLDPDNARFAYAYAVALNDGGQRTLAIRELERALKRQPYDRDVLLALALFERDAGHATRAMGHARRLAELEPDNAEIQELVRQLRASGP